MKLFNILMIDDKYQLLLPGIKEVADNRDINVLTAASIKDGMNLLKKFSGIINAVILDLGFPEGEMQGIEGLKLIKNQFPNIPVIVLTKSDTAEDFQTATLCIKAGAFDYVGKSTLNIEHLFHIVDNGMKQCRLELKQYSLHSQKEDINPPYVYFSEIEDEKEFYTSSFSYKLQTVSIHHNDIQLNQLRISADNWHNYFIEVLLPAFSPYIAIKVLYRKEEYQKIQIYIMFMLNHKVKNELNKLLLELQNDVESYFFHHLNENVYSFSPVNSIEEFQFLNHPDLQGEKISLNKKPFSIELNKTKIGFANHEISSEKSEFPSFPVLITVRDDKSFYQSLLNSSGRNIVICEILPFQLQKETIEMVDNIKHGKINLSSLIGTEKQQYYLHYCNEIINQATTCFLSRVSIISSKENIDRHLLMAVAEYFYGGSNNVEYKSNDIEDFSPSNEYFIDGFLKYLYINYDLRNIFRLPYPQQKSFLGLDFLTLGVQMFHGDIATKGINVGVRHLNNSETDIFIDDESLKKHIYVLGQTGTGKSTILKTLTLNLMKQNNGLCLIDPHGDLFEDIKANIPDHRKKDVLIFDTSDIENSQKINLLECNPKDETQKTTIINELNRILNEVYNMKIAGGPMFETYFRNSALLAMDEAVVKVNGVATLAEAHKIIMDDEYRKFALTLTKNEKILTEFKAIENTTGDYQWDNFKPYITSKFNLFLENEYINKLYNHKGDCLNFRQIMDEGKILLVRLDKGQIGLSNLSLAGMVFLNKLILSVMSRGNIEREKRRDFYIIIDEFQNFIFGDVGSALSEVRKYNTGMVLANQTLGQLNDAVIQSVLGNVGSTLFFRPGLNDYFKINHYFEPDFTKEEVLNLPNFNCIARLMHKNKPSKPFVFQTIQHI